MIYLIVVVVIRYLFSYPAERVSFWTNLINDTWDLRYLLTSVHNKLVLSTITISIC